MSVHKTAPWYTDVNEQAKVIDRVIATRPDDILAVVSKMWEKYDNHGRSLETIREAHKMRMTI